MIPTQQHDILKMWTNETRTSFGFVSEFDEQLEQKLEFNHGRNKWLLTSLSRGKVESMSLAAMLYR